MIALPNPHNKMKLSDEQLNQLVRLYAEQVVDSMDVRDLCAFAIDTICDNMCNMSSDDVQAEIVQLYDEEVLKDLLESIENVDG